jgi:replicative superfamily II helicase
MYNIKYINAQLAKTTYSFTNTKKKLLKTNAVICFNKKCRNHELTPKQINIKVNRNKKNYCAVIGNNKKLTCKATAPNAYNIKYIKYV